MSSHREAPQIAKDPVADSTDVYAFVSPDKPDTVTLIANYVPLQLPDGGPNFYEFGDDVLYEIHVDNTGNGKPDISYQFSFTSTNTIPGTFLYNVGPIETIASANWNRKQFYDFSVVTYTSGMANPPTTVATGLRCPPCHIGAIFDNGILRPFAADHTTFGLKNVVLSNMPGINSTDRLNVHTIAMQVPIKALTAGHTRPTSPTASNAVIGVWTTASRKAAIVNQGNGTYTETGAYTQVSRLGNPLVNEVLIPLSKKDFWNSQAPSGDSQFASDYSNPELAQLLPVLYPGVFPHLAAYNKHPNRADLVAILLTGIPKGVISPNFTTQINGSSTQADLLRLNVAIPPTEGSKRNHLGVLGGDLAGFPNGRRYYDDITTIELRAVAGLTLPLVDKSYEPDAAAKIIAQGLDYDPQDITAKGREVYQDVFPYLGRPWSGYDLEELQVMS
jgi:hypothetical protein